MTPPPERDLIETGLANPGRPAAWEWAVLSALVVGCLLAWSRYYFSFEMHNPDFFGIKEMADAIFGLHLPGTLKRMPGYPFIIGLVALFIPADRPLVHASMIVNLTCSAASLVVLFFLARRLIGRAALIPVIALAATPMFSLMATQTMLEAFMGLLILGTFLLSSRGSQWAYATAAWATVCRQECIVLVPLVWAMNLSEQPRAWPKHTLKAFLAGLVFVGWQLFARWAGSRVGGAEAYAKEMAGMGWHLEWRKVWLMLEPFPNVNLMFQGPLLALALIGVIIALRRWPRMALMILGFFLFYNAVHVVFSVYRLRYAYPVLFVVPLFATAGGQWLLAWLGEKTADRPRLQIVGGVVVALLGLAWIGNRWLDFGDFDLMLWQHREDFLGLAILVFVALGVTGFLATRRRTPIRFAVAIGLIAFASGPVLLSADIRAHEQGYYDNENIEFRYAADWIADHLPPGDSVAVPRGFWLLNWEDQIDMSRLYDVTQFDSEDPAAFADDLDRIGIDYLIMTKTLRFPDDPTEVNYQRNQHWYYAMRAHLTEPLRGGTEIEGFELIDTITHDEPAVVPIEPVYVFRFVRDETPDEGDDPSRMDHHPFATRKPGSP